jgi:hypothetical protein
MGSASMKVINPKGLEPPVPLKLIPKKLYEEHGSFDFAFLCQSPKYISADADELIPIILEYMTSI